jgi:hypothetical protein
MEDRRRVLSENKGLPAPLCFNPNSFAKRNRAKTMNFGRPKTPWIRLPGLKKILKEKCKEEFMENIIPNILYKYRHFDEEGHTLSILAEGKLWLSSAKNFNDPFDTALTYDFSNLYGNEAEEWAQIAAERHMPTLTPSERKIFAFQRLAELRSIPGYIEQLKNEFIERQYEKFGICSLSASRNNLLFWAHYARNHSGICIGFHTKVIEDYADRLANTGILLDLIPVRYSRDRPKINFFKALQNPDDTEDMKTLLYTKSLEWFYEKEYRLIYWERTNFAIQIETKAISEVILGCSIAPVYRKLVLKICSSLENKPSIFQAQKSNDLFELEFEQII